MNSNQVLALWGSPNSGTTTLTVKIAKELEAMKRSVAIVSCDNETPMLPILMPNGKQNHLSLGDLLSRPRISQTDIYTFSVPVSNNISLLGYRVDDNENTYPEYSLETAGKFLASLSRLVDIVLVDCSHHINSNGLSLVGLASADRVFRVVNATLKSAMYFRSQRTYLSDTKYHYDKQLVVMNNVMQEQDENVYSNVFGKIHYSLPNTPSITEQFETGKLLESLFGREARRFEPVIRTMIKDVLSD